MGNVNAGIMPQTGETVDAGSQRVQAQQPDAVSTQAAGAVSRQHDARRYSPEQIDDLADRLLSGDKAAIGQVESHPWATDEFEAFLFSLEVELPKIVEGGPFKAGFGRQIVDSTLAEYIAEDNDEPFGSILMDYVEGLDE